MTNEEKHPKLVELLNQYAKAETPGAALIHNAYFAGLEVGRLGAAVSASPQPDFKVAVIEILANCAYRYVHPESVHKLDPQSVIDKQIDNGVETLEKFFAAAPAQEPAKCEGCKLQSLDAFEHDGCFVDKVVDREQARWQKALYDLSRKHAIAPDEIDGSGCDSGDPLDLTLAEVGQVICQLENPEDYKPAAQEQPVENSPCTCGFLRGSSAIGSKPCPIHSPQKGKP